MESVISYNTAMPNSPTNDSAGTTLPFGQALRYYRTQAGIKQDALSDMLGIEQSTLSRWESQLHPPRDVFTLSRLATILRVDIEDLRSGRIVSYEPAHVADEQTLYALKDAYAPNTPADVVRRALVLLDQLTEQERGFFLNQLEGTLLLEEQRRVRRQQGATNKENNNNAHGDVTGA